jgi:hypothetical protein
MKLILRTFFSTVLLTCSVSLNAQVKETKTLDNGVQIHSAQGVEVVKDKPAPVQKVISIEEMDVTQATEMLSVLKSKAEFAQGQDKANYQKQIVMVEERIKKLTTQKN